MNLRLLGIGNDKVDLVLLTVQMCLRGVGHITPSAEQNRFVLYYYAACSGDFLPTFRDNVSVPS
jgi:hypothetical protein